MSVYRYALIVYVAGRWIYSLRDASYVAHEKIKYGGIKK